MSYLQSRRIESGASEWPTGWNDLPDPPAAVRVTGTPEYLLRPAMAVVGTRAATPRGQAIARRLGRELAARGWVVVSGLALGVDGEAHRGALDVEGTTVAIMATSLDRTYPPAHRDLRRRIEAAGCCVTEAVEGHETLGRWMFPRRNRLIAAMTVGTIVVEAPRRSGALITAGLAADLGRTVWAVPGPIDQPTSEGCHDLIKQGALVCTGVADIDAAVAPPRVGSAASSTRQPAAGSAADWIWRRLDLDGVSVEDLRARWPGNDAMWSEGLLALELGGLIRRLPGGRLAPKVWLA